MNVPRADLELSRKTLRAEGSAVASLAERIGESFARACEAVHGCEGTVVLTGIGKAGIVARKTSATLASTGTPSIFLHPVEALHGDLGRVGRGDVVIAASHSGQTEEIIRLMDHIKGRGATLVAMTSSADSALGRHADITICYGEVAEACPLGLAPTVSTTCMLALGDALALTVMEMRRFKPEDFAVFHPAGSLGRKLLKVEDAMTFRRGDQLPLANDSATLGEALCEAEEAPRRAGAMLAVDAAGKLSGILTDADLRRLMVFRPGEDLLAQPVSTLMIRDPKHIHLGELASRALAVLNEYRIDELPVVDDEHRPVGLIDVQDLLGIKTVDNGSN